MKCNQAFQIKVPASTANLGPGFDSLGLALNRYLTLQVERSKEWEFVLQSEEIADTPTNKDNFIYQMAAKVANDFSCELPPCKIYVQSNIPLARGLGSSAAAIIAAIELVNELCNLQLTNKQKLDIACDFEGHPDNVGASLYGGLVIGSHRGSDDTDLVHVNDLEFDMVVVIPPYELKTKDARSVLPLELSYQESVKASSISNVMVAALLTKNLELIGKMMELDLFHQQYRAKLIPEYNDIRQIAKRAGAFGVALSGAGPTVICFTESGQGLQLKDELSLAFEGYQVEEVSIEKNGSIVTSLSLHE